MLFYVFVFISIVNDWDNRLCSNLYFLKISSMSAKRNDHIAMGLILDECVSSNIQMREFWLPFVRRNEVCHLHIEM